MIKRRVAFAISALALMGGASVLAPNYVHAYMLDDDGYALPTGETEAEKYNDLKLAISENKNIRLNSDIYYYISTSAVPSISIDHSTVLDLNGYSLSTASTGGGTGGNTSIAVSGEGTVFTITDSSQDKAGAIKYEHTGNASPELVRIEGGAKVVLESGNLVSPYGRSGEGFGVLVKGTGGTLEISGGRISSHPDTASKSNYGVRFNSDGAFTMTGGEVSTVGSALYVNSGKVVAVNVSGESQLASSSDAEINITSTVASGKLSSVTADKIIAAGSVTLENVQVSNLELKGGERSLSGLSVDNLTISAGTTNIGNVSVNDTMNITGGTVVLNDGADVKGGLTYQTAASGSLTINEGAKVNNFEQLGKSATASYTDAETGQKVSVNYITVGGLEINGGTFSGSFDTVAKADVEAANATRQQFVEDYNAHSGKAPLTYSDVAAVPAISGGVFAEEPDADEITPENEAEYSEELGGYEILPKKIDWSLEGFIKTDTSFDDQMDVTMEIGKELIADRKASLSSVLIFSDSLVLDASKGGELVGAFDIKMLNRDGGTIEVKENDLNAVIGLDEEYTAILGAYDRLYAVYFNYEGVEVERFNATLGGSELIFGTTHLSTYGVVGVNDAVEEPEEPGEEAGEAAASSSAPDTGTMTAAGASAYSAGIITVFAISLLTSVVSFSFFYRKLVIDRR